MIGVVMFLITEVIVAFICARQSGKIKTTFSIGKYSFVKQK